MNNKEIKYFNIEFTENQKALIVDFLISTSKNEVYLYEDQILFTGQHLLVNNQIVRLFEFNLSEDRGLKFNKNQQKVIADYISVIYEEYSIYNAEFYELEYNYLKQNGLLNELFDAVCKNPKY